MYNNEIQCNTSSSWPKRDTVTLFDRIEIHFTNPSRITFQTLNKKLIAIPNSAIYDPPTESNQFNPIPFTRLTGHDLSTPAESTPPLAVQWPRNIRRLLSRARYIQIAFRLTGTEIAFIFSYRKIAAGLKVDPFTSSSPETFSLARRPSFPPPPPPLSWSPFSAKGWKSPKAICRGALWQIVRYISELCRHALQAQSAISCVRRRAYVYAHAHARARTRGKLFLARGIRGFEAFVSSCMVARAPTRLMIVSPGKLSLWIL